MKLLALPAKVIKVLCEYAETTGAHTWERLLYFTVFICLCSLYFTGIELNLHNNVTERARFHAIPIAISQLYHGRIHDYTGYKEVTIPFQGPENIQQLIDQAKVWPVKSRDSLYFWAADDRGLSDLVYLSFILFGPSIGALYNCYFGLFLLSFLTVLLNFRHNGSAISVLVLFLAGYICYIYQLPELSGTNWTNFSVNLAESRTFEIAGLILVLHISMVFIFQRSVSAKHYFSLICNIILFTFWYHTRSSLNWEVLTIFVLVASTIVCGYPHNINVIPGLLHNLHRYRHVLIVPTLLGLCLVGLKIYQRNTFNPYYFAESGDRTVWHNSLMGIYNPVLGTEYGLPRVPNDTSVIIAVIAYSQKKGLIKSQTLLNVDELLNTLGGHSNADWRSYEKLSREMYFSLWKERPLGMLKNYTYHKPIAMYQSFRQYFVPNGLWVIALILIPLITLVNTDKTELIRLTDTIFITWLFSASPSLLFYPSPLTMGAFNVLLMMLAVMMIAVAGSFFLRQAGSGNVGSRDLGPLCESTAKLAK